jgi:hypothetical protein
MALSHWIFEEMQQPCNVILGCILVSLAAESAFASITTFTNNANERKLG